MERAQEMSFVWPHHSVDIAERVLASEQSCVVCVSRDKSKTFIAFNVCQEFWRRNVKCGKMILLVDDEKATIVEPFLTGISNQSLLSVKAFFKKPGVEDEWNCSFSMCDIIVTTGEAFAQRLIARTMELSLCSLIIFDQCHLVLNQEHHFAIILQKMKESNLESRPHIMGLSSQILCHQDCSEDMEIFLTSLEQIFNCRTLISSDLLALNRYGEYTEMEIGCFNCSHVQDPHIFNLSKIFERALFFLKDYRMNQVTETCVIFARHILTEGHRVLLLLGSWCTWYMAKITVREIDKLEKKSVDGEIVLILQFCRTQIRLVISILEQEKLEVSVNDLTDLGSILLSRTSMHLKPEHQEVNNSVPTLGTNQGLYEEPLQSCESCLIDKVSSSESQDILQGPNTQSLNLQTSYGTKNQCNDPLCVILVPSTIIAKALNSLLNKLSNAVVKYSFLKSACIHGNKAKEEMKESSFSDEVDENVMVCVQDGSVNVLIATFEIEQELYAKRCSLLIRLGMPNAYENYYSVKSKLKSAGGSLVVLVREEELAETEAKYQIFQRIEKLLWERCPNSRPPGHETRKLFQESQADVYQPLGEGGAKVELLSSIALVNSYCGKFPSSGVGYPVPVCRMQEVWSNKEVQFVATLFLPRNSPVYQPIKGSVTLKKTDINEDTMRKAKVKSEMLAALEACRLLHKREELTDDLQPLFRWHAYNLTVQHEPCDCEVADGGVGVDGTVTRNRAYKRKFPTLLENNFPVCGEPCYVYSLTMELTKPWNFERAVRSRSKAKATSDSYSIGVLSRKPLPKLPRIAIFDRAGEVTVTVTECCPQSIFLTADQLSLLQRFTEYVFKEIARPKKESSATFLSFDPTIAFSGYYILFLKDASSSRSLAGLSSNNHKEVAFDFMFSLEDKLGCFKNPVYSGPPDITDAEIFRDTVVTATYNEKRSHYYVADICYDLSPSDPFPNIEVAGTFAEYVKIRYDVEVSLDQPMLDVDHTSSRLNFLLPKYENFKGQHPRIPEKNSKRSRKSKVYLIPELCSIHPVPGHLWRQLSNLPAVLYRIESLLVAEELRCWVVRDLGIGVVDWPKDVPLPPVTVGETMGEEILPAIGSSAVESNGKRSSQVALVNLTSPFSAQLPEVFMDLKISNQVELTEKSAAKSLAGGLSNGARESCLSMSSENFLVEHSCAETECKPLFRPAPHQGLLIPSKEKEDFWPNKLSDLNVPLPTERRAFDCDSIPANDKESEVSAVSIWTDPFLSNLYRTCGPPSSLILRALTTTLAGDVFSLERLEVLGDSFVKYAISSSVFFKHRYENEGVLSFLRGIKVSNRQLFYLARQRGLPSYMFTRMFNPLVNWLPPGFYLDDDSNAENSGYEHRRLISDTFLDEVDDEEDDESIFAETESSGYNSDCRQGESPDVQLNSYLHVCCSDKSIADCTEALIGAFLLCFGLDGAFKFLEWLGMEIARDEKDENLVQKPSSDDSARDAVPKPASTMCHHYTSHVPQQASETLQENLSLLDDETVPSSSIDGLSSEHESTVDEFKDVEEALHYRFHDKSLLMQAFTHSSLPGDYNSVRNSYEQLEFLGDALLDFLVTRYLYVNHRHMSPGELTDLRTALVNNYSFAVLAVKLGFPRHLRSCSPQLFGMVNKFMVKLKEKERKHAITHRKNDEIYSSVFVMETEGRDDPEQVEVPKVLGDLFEAVAGAMYLDCGADIEMVWEVYLPILKPSMDYYSEHPPMSAIRRLLEMKPYAAKFAYVPLVYLFITFMTMERFRNEDERLS